MAAGMAPVVGLVLLLALLPSSSSIVIPVSGNVYPLGQFFVSMNIGEPAKPYFLDIDTASNLTWLECDAGSGSCETCNKVPHPLYRATAHKLVPCVDQLCSTLHQDLGTPKDCRYAQQCDYEIAYLDGSGSRGVLLLDKFSLPTAVAHPTIAFGCGYDQVEKGKGEKVPVDGILGLGRGLVDLVSQLKGQKIITQNVIGHCFSSKGGGSLLIGEVLPPSPRIHWVPMSGNSKYYSPGRASLHLDTKSIVTKPMEVILDSGSSYTHFPKDLHAQLVAALKASLGKSLKEIPDPALPDCLCWKGPEKFKQLDDLKKEFKSVISLKFDNATTMMIPPENYLIITEHGNACFGILGEKDMDMYIIGDITMQDHLVIYDNENERLAWQQYPCGRR